MDKIIKPSGCYVNMWSLNQKISGLTFVNPNIPALKYGRSMEENAVNHFYDLMKTKHRNLTLHECGLYLDKDIPFIGGSLDRVVTCDCCATACLEVKCPYSINYTTPEDPNVSQKLPYLQKDNEILMINKKHKYFTQCQIQMAVTGYQHCYFMVWTPHGHFLQQISFDEDHCKVLMSKFKTYYNDFYLNSIYSHL